MSARKALEEVLALSDKATPGAVVARSRSDGSVYVSVGDWKKERNK